MAHFDYPPGTPLGTVPSLYAVPSEDWAHVIGQLFKAANFDDGGTWAPGAFITVGGSGFQFTGTGHSLAASARLNVESTGEIRLKNGSTLRADGSLGDVLLQVLTNVATLTIQAGAVLDVAGVQNVTGALEIESGGEATVKSGASLVLASGGTLTLASGATVSIAANPSLSGALTVTGTGGIVLQNGAAVTGVAGSSCTLQGQTNLYALTLVGSTTWPEFSAARPWTVAVARVTPLSYAGASTGPANPDIWTERSNVKDSLCYRTSDRTASGGESLFEFEAAPLGGTITGATITTRGTEVLGLASDLPVFKLVSWIDSDAANFTAHSLATTDDGLPATFPNIATQTTIAATGSPTVTAGRKYGLLVTHPFEAITSQGMRVYECSMTGTFAAIKR